MHANPTNNLSELEKHEPLLQRSLRAGRRSLHFPAELERIYRLFVFPSRRQRYALLAAIALICYDLFIVCDWFILPDIFALAAVVRLLVVTPAILIGILLTRRKGGARLLEPVASGLLLLSLGSLSLFMVLSSHPNVIHYYSGIAVILMFSNMVIRQPFPYALTVSLTTCLLYVVTVSQVQVMSMEAAISSTTVVFTSALFSLVGNYQMEFEHRRDFLLSALQQISSRKLARMNSKLEHLSLTDGLTGLANRRHFDLTLQREWHVALRNRYPVALVFLDVDHFKNYNDHYGHPAGDVCLQRIGGVLTRVSRRAQDLPARYGGEEFVVLLPHTDEEHAGLLAEEVRRDIEELGIEHHYSEAAPVVTVSLGVAAFVPDKDLHADDLVSLADQAMYEAKSAGRNCIRVAAVPAAAVAD